MMLSQSYWEWNAESKMIISNCHSITKLCLKLILLHVQYSRVCINQEAKRHLAANKKEPKHMSCSVTRNSSLSMAWVFKKFSTEYTSKSYGIFSTWWYLGNVSKDRLSPMDANLRNAGWNTEIKFPMDMRLNIEI